MKRSAQRPQAPVSVLWPLLGVQAFAALITAGIWAALTFWLPPEHQTAWHIALVQGAWAAFIAWRFELARWWWFVHALAPALMVTLLATGWPPWVWLLCAVALYLIYGRTDRSRVPLYLTPNATIDALAQFLQTQPAGQFIDLGCGEGRVLRGLHDRLPEWELRGVEHALVPWALAAWRARGMEVSVRWGSLWEEPLHHADVVYCFLSPAPMPALWQKALIEMAPGALLISVDFEIPDETPIQIIEVGPGRGGRLLVYRPRS